MLRLLNLTAGVNNKTILNGISHVFKKNRVYVIVGPNGSGKSTLAHVVMGNPTYTVGKGSKLAFGETDLTELPPDKRAKLGIFLSFQSPHSLRGVTVFQLLRMALDGAKDPLALRQEVYRVARMLKVKKEMIEHPLNEGASGGEKKKMEVLQAAVINPEVAIFDEVDTGVDVDALKIFATFVKSFRKDKTLIFITHNFRILKHITPDEVLVMKEGRIIRTGGHDLLETVENEGFGNL